MTERPFISLCDLELNLAHYLGERRRAGQPRRGYFDNNDIGALGEVAYARYWGACVRVPPDDPSVDGGWDLDVGGLKVDVKASRWTRGRLRFAAGAIKDADAVALARIHFRDEGVWVDLAGWLEHDEAMAVARWVDDPRYPVQSTLEIPDGIELRHPDSLPRGVIRPPGAELRARMRVAASAGAVPVG